MLELFDAMPAGWQAGPQWPAPTEPRAETRRRFARFFRENYRRIIESSESASRDRGPG
jgi:hypothetical protein